MSYWNYSPSGLYKNNVQQQAAAWAQAHPIQTQASQQQIQQLNYQANQLMAQSQRVQAQTKSEADELISWGSKNSSTDGKDDGKIGFWSGAGHFLKGATVGFVRSALGFDKEGNFHLGQALKNLATAAVIGVATVATGGAALAVVGAIGAVSAGIGAVKAGIGVAQAKTDQEAKDYCEEMGTNATAFALSATAVKAGMKQMNPTADYSGIKGTGRAFKDLGAKTLETGKNAVNTIAEGYVEGGFAGAGKAIVNGGKTELSKMGSRLAEAYKGGSTEKFVENKNKEYETKIQELTEKRNADGVSAKTKASIDKQIKQLKSEQQAYSKISEAKSFEEAQAKISEAESNINKLQRALENESNKARQKVYQKQIKAAKSELEIYKDVTNKRVLQARNTRAEIDRLSAKEQLSSAEQTRLAELQARTEIELPARSSHKSYTQAARQNSVDLLKAEKDLAKAKTQDVVYNSTSDEGMLAAVHKYNAQSRVTALKSNLANNTSMANASGGYSVRGAAGQFTRGISSELNGQYGTALGGQKLFGFTVVPKVNISGTKTIGAYSTPTFVEGAAGNTTTSPSTSGLSYQDYQMLEYALRAQGIA